MSDLEPKIIKQEQSENYTCFVIEPLDQGFGQTLGNGLRRVLFSQLGGAAVTKVKVSGAPHQFAVLPGVKEDGVELLLNLKKVHFQMTKKATTIVVLNAQGPGKVLASQIECPTGIEVINKDFEIASLSDKKAKLEMEITVEYNKGYRLAESSPTVGVLSLDANFSPVERVNFRVEEARVGRLTNFDRLILEIWTNGSIEPKDGLKQAAAILAEQFGKVAQGTLVEKIENPNLSTSLAEAAPSPVAEEETYLEELGLPTRTLNTLKKAGIETAKDVLGKSAEELSQIKHIGPKTVELILKKVKKSKD